MSTPAETTSTRSYRWYLAGGLIACAVYFVLPASTGREALYALVALSMPCAAAIGMIRDRPTPHRGWSLLTAGVAVVGCAEVVLFVVITILAKPQWEPSLDYVFAVGYLVQLAGLMTMIQSRTTSKNLSAWLDAAGVGVAALTVVWSSLYGEMVRRNLSSVLSWVSWLGQPVLGVAMVAMAVRLVLGERRLRSGFGLLLLGYIFQTIPDTLTNLLKGYVPGSAIDVMWIVGYVLMGAALLHPGRLALPRQAPTVLARREVNQVLALQGAVIVAVVGVMAFQVARLLPVSTMVVWTGAGLAMLVINRLRVYSLVRLVGDASQFENEQRLTALVSHSHEIIGLADPDGTIRYVSPAVETITGVPAAQWLGEPFTKILPENVAGVSELIARVVRLAPGAVASWEGEIRPTHGGVAKTMKVEVVNHLETPEVNGWVITARDVTDEARLTSELRHRALHDTLTGLPNRALLFDRIEHALDRVRRTNEIELAVLLVDLDDFKSVNDNLGHNTGDALLRGVAERLSIAVRPGDTVARLGGDEFAILLEDTSEADALLVAQRAMESLALPVQIGNADFAVMASVGVVAHRGASDPVELLRFADIAMYEAKRDGKARVKLFREDMHHAARNQLELRMDLAAALDRHELTLAYQPIVDTADGRICGVEALLRWNHPTRGAVPPAEFIPVAEQSGLIGTIGEWVLRTACYEAATWPLQESDPYISVNVSAAQISDRGFVASVLRALRDSQLPADRLLLEITETMLVDDDVQARKVLTELRALGVRIAIDDFGTGFSSLAYLRQLAVDVVKIDQSFVRDLGTNSDHQALTRTMLALADGLAMTAIAEGVETEGELNELSRLGCNFAQGYLFSYPIPAAALATLLGETAIDIDIDIDIESTSAH
jgi:diguanylate cyclase (GGDEF)-like protein/PAS domain S-box-containing protein